MTEIWSTKQFQSICALLHLVKNQRIAKIESILFNACIWYLWALITNKSWGDSRLIRLWKHSWERGEEVLGCFVIRPCSLCMSILLRQNFVPPTWFWLQVPSTELGPNNRFMIHCLIFFIHIKLILLTEEVSGVSRLMMLIALNGINTSCGSHSAFLLAVPAF